MIRFINGDCAVETQKIHDVSCIITSPSYMEEGDNPIDYSTRTADLLMAASQACKDDAWMWLQLSDPLWLGPNAFGVAHSVLLQLTAEWDVRHEIILVRDRLTMPSRPIAYAHDHLYALSRGEPDQLRCEAASVWPVDNVNFYDTGDPRTSFMSFDPMMVRRCVAMATLPGDLVMDPLCGSGVVGNVCEEMERDFIGIEKVKEALSVA